MLKAVTGTQGCQHYWTFSAERDGLAMGTCQRCGLQRLHRTIMTMQEILAVEQKPLPGPFPIDLANHLW